MRAYKAFLHIYLCGCVSIYHSLPLTLCVNTFPGLYDLRLCYGYDMFSIISRDQSASVLRHTLQLSWAKKKKNYRRFTIEKYYYFMVYMLKSLNTHFLIIFLTVSQSLAQHTHNTFAYRQHTE